MTSDDMNPAGFARVNDRAIEAKQKLIDRLDVLRIGAGEADLFNINKQRASLKADLDMQKIIQQRLAAATVTVTPLDPATLAGLNQRAQLLDDAIVHDTIVNADLTFVTQLAAAAKGIGNILDGKTSS